MSGNHLLVVEGRGSVSARWKRIAELAGLRAVVTYSPRMAGSMIRHVRPAIVLLSDCLGPPGVSEVARRIKEDPETAAIPVVIITDRRRADRVADYYPTEACLPIETADESLVGTIRLLTGRSTAAVRPAPEPLAPEPRREMGALEGHLEADLLADVLEYLFIAGKTGRITVRSDGPGGRIYIAAGKVVHAEHAGAHGVAAFERLCFLERGYFRFEPSERPMRPTMDEDGIGLLLEAARAKDTRDRDLREGRLVQTAPVVEMAPRIASPQARRRPPVRPYQFSFAAPPRPGPAPRWRPGSKTGLRWLAVPLVAVLAGLGATRIGPLLGFLDRQGIFESEPDALFAPPEAAPDEGLEAPRRGSLSGRRSGRDASFQPPRRLAGTEPRYPLEARALGLAGTVIADIDVDEKGGVAAVRIVRSAGPLLDRAVIGAIGSWRFAPATEKGRPVPATVTYRRTFRPLAE